MFSLTAEKPANQATVNVEGMEIKEVNTAIIPTLQISSDGIVYTMGDPRNAKHGILGNIVDMWERRNNIKIVVK